MNENEFKELTKQLALRCMKLCEGLPVKTSAQVIGRQLLRSATSVGANYRAACRAKSTADFIHKLSIVEEEADESIYWLELLIDSQVFSPDRLKPLIDDFHQVVGMIVKSIKTTRASKEAQPTKTQNPKPKKQL